MLEKTPTGKRYFGRSILRWENVKAIRCGGPLGGLDRKTQASEIETAEDLYMPDGIVLDLFCTRKKKIDYIMFD